MIGRLRDGFKMVERIFIRSIRWVIECYQHFQIFVVHVNLPLLCRLSACMLFLYKLEQIRIDDILVR